MLSVVMLVRVATSVIRVMTQEAIAALREHTEGAAPELILVRNGGEELKISRGDIGLPGATLDFPEGRSLATAYNRGMKKAHGDVLCVLHNDTVVPPDWNVPLEAAARKGHLAFPMVDESRSNCEYRGIPKTAPWQTTGACFVMSRPAWDLLGGYDENYNGFHWEDTDLFYRAMQAGVQLVRCPVTVVHYRGATRTFTRDEERGHFERNLDYHKRKHGDAYAPVISESPQEV